jgi:hypothetical protein
MEKKEIKRSVENIDKNNELKIEKVIEFIIENYKNTIFLDSLFKYSLKSYFLDKRTLEAFLNYLRNNISIDILIETIFLFNMLNEYLSFQKDNDIFKYNISLISRELNIIKSNIAHSVGMPTTFTGINNLFCSKYDDAFIGREMFMKVTNTLQGMFYSKGIDCIPYIENFKEPHNLVSIFGSDIPKLILYLTKLSFIVEKFGSVHNFGVPLEKIHAILDSLEDKDITEKINVVNNVIEDNKLYSYIGRRVKTPSILHNGEVVAVEISNKGIFFKVKLDINIDKSMITHIEKSLVELY